MAQHIQKPIDRPDHISLLLPTRGRPETLRLFFESLEESTRDKAALDVWIYVDDDDASTRQAIDAGNFRKFTFKTNWVIRERAMTLGDMLNRLREACNTNPGIYSVAADDYLFNHKEWDVEVREVFRSTPDRIILAYPSDPTTGDTQAANAQATWPILSAEWTNTLGRFAMGMFPYWFEDTWLDQVAQMVNRKTRLNFKIEPQGGKGKTLRMRNLIFWQLFFDNLLDDRMNEADQLLKRTLALGGEPKSNGAAYLENVAANFRKEALARNFSDISATETALADNSEAGQSPLLRTSYFNVELEAVKVLYGKMVAAAERKDYETALRLNANIGQSSVRLKYSAQVEEWLLKQSGIPSLKSIPGLPPVASGGLLSRLFG